MKVDVPLSSLALQSLTEASLGASEHGWEVGWSLASYDTDSQPLMDVMRTEVGIVSHFHFYLIGLVLINVIIWLVNL